MVQRPPLPKRRGDVRRLVENFHEMLGIVHRRPAPTVTLQALALRSSMPNDEFLATETDYERF